MFFQLEITKRVKGALSLRPLWCAVARRFGFDRIDSAAGNRGQRPSSIWTARPSFLRWWWRTRRWRSSDRPLAPLAGTPFWTRWGRRRWWTAASCPRGCTRRSRWWRRRRIKDTWVELRGDGAEWAGWIDARDDWWPLALAMAQELKEMLCCWRRFLRWEIKQLDQSKGWGMNVISIYRFRAKDCWRLQDSLPRQKWSVYLSARRPTERCRNGYPSRKIWRQLNWWRWRTKCWSRNCSLDDWKLGIVGWWQLIRKTPRKNRDM